MMRRLVRGSMRSCVVLWWLAGVLLTHQAWGKPIVPHQLESPALSLVPELGPRLGALGSRLQEPRLPLPLPLPSAQELDAIKKVAQILVMLGEQVIPAILGELPPPPSPPSPYDHAAAIDVPYDAVSDKQIK